VSVMTARLLLGWDAVMVGANLGLAFWEAVAGYWIALLFVPFAMYWIWQVDRDWHRLRALHRASP
jgi:hypothetical protein